MKQSPNDPKHYKALTLSNGLRVLLIENAESNRSAAALAVNTGHFDDPADRQGMAHFLEHMLFLGTQKYPNSGEYQQYLSQHSGSNNAWTGTEHTCYFFDINHQHLENALDRFSQFFISPLLSQEFIEKERLNIDSEFKLKLKDDMRRIYDVHKATINPKHPFSKFSVGNSDTLADNDTASLRNEIIQFYNEHYQASRMTLAIEGPQSLEKLEALAVEKFSSIKNDNIIKAPISEPLYLKEHLGLKLLIKPEKNDNKLIVSFALPGIDKDYLFKPVTALGYLLGHESQGSILSYLKKRQWAMSLTAAGGINGSNFKDFNISIRLTEEGEKHQEDIIALIFAYIELIKKDGIRKVYYDEKKAISEFSFQYQEKLKPIDSVSQLVINMQHYPQENYIYGDYIMQQFSPDLIRNYLNYFTPENMRVISINKHCETNRISKWYKVPYRTESLSSSLISRIKTKESFSELVLPEQNQYIVENPIIAPANDSPKEPELIKNDKSLKVWFKQDCSFFVPKGQIFIGIDSHVAIASKKNIAMCRLFVDLFSDSVLEQNYHAELAGIHYHLYPHQGGMTLQLSGINAKQPLLLEKLLDSIKDHSLNADRFNLFKTQLIRNWRNADKSKSISQLFSKLSALMKPFSPSGIDLADALEGATYDEFCLFCHDFFNHLCIEAFIYGNWLKPEAESMSQMISNKMKEHLNATNNINTAVVDYKGKGASILPQHLPNHDYASVIYFPMVSNNVKTMAHTMIASHLISPQFFHQMRTQRQFGYLVGVGYVPMNRYPGIAFYIQSPDSNTDTLFVAINEFIEQFDCQVPEQEWRHLQQGLIGQLTEKDTSPRIKSQRYWVSICNKDYAFTHKEELIAAITNTTLDDIAQFISSNLKQKNAPDKISLASVKHADEYEYLPDNHTLIKDVAQFHLESKLKH